jgi:hypothetical protein
MLLTISQPSERRPQPLQAPLTTVRLANHSTSGGTSASR